MITLSVELTEFCIFSTRDSLQQIVGFAHGQHEELKEQQEQLLQAHNLLASNSRSMLKAQVLYIDDLK